MFYDMFLISNYFISLICVFFIFSLLINDNIAFYFCCILLVYSSAFGLFFICVVTSFVWCYMICMLFLYWFLDYTISKQYLRTYICRISETCILMLHTFLWFVQITFSLVTGSPRNRYTKSNEFSFFCWGPETTIVHKPPIRNCHNHHFTIFYHLITDPSWHP